MNLTLGIEGNRILVQEFGWKISVVSKAKQATEKQRLSGYEHASYNFSIKRLQHRINIRFNIQVFVPPLPPNVVELRTRIAVAVAEVTPEMLRRVWQESDCLVTSGSHIEL
jgi:hypothetical protein